MSTYALDRLKVHPLTCVPGAQELAIIIIEVMPKRELLDPAGKAVHQAIQRDGISSFSDVRIGKRFELSVDGDVTDEHMAQAKALADDLLSNGVIEDVVDIRVGDVS